MNSPKIDAYKNIVDNIKLQIDNKNPLFNTQLSVDKIGTKYYESNLLKLNDEIELLKKIINYQKNKKYVYVVKRSTSSKKISEIKKYLNISVIYFGMPLELSLLKDNRKLPKNIFSLGSGLDMTIPTLFKKINIYLINIKGLKKNKWYKHSSKFFNLFFKLDQKKKL